MRRILFVFIVLILSACKKTLPHHNINSALYSAYAFKNGTYWIYKDSITNEIDSYSVTNARLQIQNQTNYTQDVYNCIISIYKSDTAINKLQTYKYNILIMLSESYMVLQVLTTKCLSIKAFTYLCAIKNHIK